MNSDLIQSIQFLIEQDEFGEAMDLINEIQDSFLEDSFFFYLKAYTCFRLEDFDEAVHSYQRSIELDPTNCAAYSDLGYVLLVQERWDEAEFFIKKAVSMNPSDPLGIERLGLLYYSMSDLEAARESFLVLFQLGQGSPRIHFFLGEIHSSLEEFEKALFYYDQCLAQDPGNQDALFGKALTLESMQEFRRAVELYEALLKTMEEGEEILDVLVSLAACYFKQEDLSQSRAMYSRALQLDPRNPQILNNMGLLSFEAGDLEAAERYLTLSLKEEETFDALFNFGKCHLRNSRLRLALSTFQKALRLAEDKIDEREAYLFLGKTYHGLKNSFLALSCLRNSHQLGCDYVELYLLLLETAEETGHREEVLEVLRKSREKGLSYYHSMFLYHMGSRNFEATLKVLNLGLRKFPEYPVLYYYKASVYAVLGKQTLAIRNLEKAIGGNPEIASMAKANACFEAMLGQKDFQSLITKKNKGKKKNDKNN